MEGADLQFTEEGLRAIAKRAQEKETGARGLRSIIEEVMLDIMFDLPEQGPGKNYLITPDVVMGRERLLALPEPKHKSA
jgi:ATP-dependent Clp protease ATP-binding subunit ClpX